MHAPTGTASGGPDPCPAEHGREGADGRRALLLAAQAGNRDVMELLAEGRPQPVSQRPAAAAATGGSFAEKGCGGPRPPGRPGLEGDARGQGRAWPADGVNHHV